MPLNRQRVLLRHKTDLECIEVGVSNVIQDYLDDILEILEALSSAFSDFLNLFNTSLACNVSVDLATHRAQLEATSVDVQEMEDNAAQLLQ